MSTLLIRKGEKELEVTLTPKYYLDKEALDTREYFENNITLDNHITIEHDPLNKYDKYALAVYMEGKTIGYIQKRFHIENRTLEIESFFFKRHLFIGSGSVHLVLGGCT